MTTPTWNNPIVKWIDYRLPVFSFMRHELIDYPTPKNLNYWWNFGSLAGIVLVIMIATGIWLAMHYTPSVDGAFARLAMRVNGMLGHFGPSRLARRLFFRDHGSLRSSVDRILEWDFDRVIMAHGEVLESGGHSLLEEAFAFLRD